MSQTTSTSYLSTAQTAAKLGLSIQTVISLAKSGELEGSFFSRRWKFAPASLDAYVESKRRSK